MTNTISLLVFPHLLSCFSSTHSGITQNDGQLSRDQGDEDSNKFAVRFSTKVKILEEEPPSKPRGRFATITNIAKRARSLMTGRSTEIDMGLERIQSSSTLNRSSVAVARRSILFALEENPSLALCTNCQEPIITDTVRHPGRYNAIVSMGVCCMGGCLGCCIIPFFMQSLMDVNHQCPTCGEILGTYKQVDY